MAAPSAPGLTEAQRAELREVLNARRRIRDQMQALEGEITRNKSALALLRKDLAKLPNMQTLATYYGYSPQTIPRLATHQYQRMNPLDAMAAEREA